MSLNLWNNYLKGLILFLKFYSSSSNNKNPKFNLNLILNSFKYFNSKNDQLIHGSLLYKLFYNLNPLFENEIFEILKNIDSINKKKNENIKFGEQKNLIKTVDSHLREEVDFALTTSEKTKSNTSDRTINSNNNNTITTTPTINISYTLIFIISSYINQNSKLFFNFLFSNFSIPNSIEMIGICNCIENIPYQFNIFEKWISKILNILIFEIFEFEKLKKMNDENLNENEFISSLININSLFFKIQGIFTKSLCYLSKRDLNLIKLILNQSLNFIKNLNEIWFKYLKNLKSNSSGTIIGGAGVGGSAGGTSGKLNKTKKIIILLKNIYPTFFEIISNLEFNLFKNNKIEKEEINLKIISILSYLDFLKDRNINLFLKENLIKDLNSKNINKIINLQMNSYINDTPIIDQSNSNNNIIGGNLIGGNNQLISLINFYLNFFNLFSKDILKDNENLIKFTFK